MEKVKKKDNRGGFREGAGRPALGSGPKVSLSVRISPEAAAIVARKRAEGVGLSEWIDNLILKENRKVI